MHKEALILRALVLLVSISFLSAFLGFLWCIMILMFPADFVWGQQDGKKEKLDVLLIIDDSGSMKTTDPKQLRVKAAQAFIGYLRLNEDKLDARVGVVLFASDVVLSSPLTVVSKDVQIRESIKVTNKGLTNFPKALEQAYLEFGAFNRSCAYILFTDGQPESLGKRPDRDQYPKIESWVNRFKEKACQLYVLAIGEAQRDEAQWQEFARGPIISKSTGKLVEGYHRLEKIEDIYDKYRDILKELTGIDFGESCGKGEGPYIVNVEPYLQKIIFAIVKWVDPNVIVGIQKPDGTLLEPEPPNVIHTGGKPSWDEGYSILKPMPGNWRITVKGGSVSCWADRYFLKIRKLKPPGEDRIDHVAGIPLEIEACLVDPEGNCSPSLNEYPREITATLIKKGILDEEITTVRLNEAPSGVFKGELPGQDEGDYFLKLTAKALQPAEVALDEEEYSLLIGEFPYIDTIITHDVEVGNKAQVDVYIGRVETISKGGHIDVKARWKSKPVASRKDIACNLVINNQFRCELGNTLPDNTIGPFDRYGKYEAEIHISGQTNKGQAFPLEGKTGFQASKDFCVTKPRNTLPLPDVAKAKVTQDQEGKIKPEVGKEAFIQVPIQFLEETTPERLTVEATVIDPDGRRTQLVNLTWVDENIYAGKLESLAEAGKHKAQIEVRGTTPDGCAINAMQQIFDFQVIEFVPLPLFLLRLFVRYGVPSVGALAVLVFIIWYLFLRDLVTPSVDGKLIITDPSGTELPPVDLYGRGARISIGSEGNVRLDHALDSNVAGIVAELRAKVVDRRKVVRSVWYRQGDQFEEGPEIYHGDEFSVGRFRLRYENLAAEREFVSELLEAE